MSKETVKGSCHCGKVKFQARVDFSKGTSRCNCSYCQKNRYWGLHVEPSEFNLLSGKDSLQSYSKSRRDLPFDMDRELGVYENDLSFCKTCGLHAFNIGNIPEIGGRYVSINVACLDDVDFKKIMSSPLQYMDGKNDDWFNVPSITEHL